MQESYSIDLTITMKNGKCQACSYLLQTELDDKKFCYLLFIITTTKFVIFSAFLKLKHSIFQQFFLLELKIKKPFKCMQTMSNYFGITHTALLYFPISAEIRTIESQSDLRIFL